MDSRIQKEIDGEERKRKKRKYIFSNLYKKVMIGRFLKIFDFFFKKKRAFKTLNKIRWI